jgi:hypothetical protein
MNGLAEDAFEGMPPEEVVMRVGVRARLVRLSHKFAHLPTEEAEARFKEELRREERARTLEERQERRRHTE